jgi:chromosome partitioning protein
VTEFNPKGQAAGEVRRLWSWIERRMQAVRPLTGRNRIAGGHVQAA